MALLLIVHRHPQAPFGVFTRVPHGLYDAGGEARDAHMRVSAADILNVGNR